MRLLDAFLEARRERPFEWGVHDCCTFASDWVLACTGYDPMADLRGRMTALAAMRQMRDLGGFRAVGVQRLGPSIPAVMAQVGDVCLVPSGRRKGRGSGYSFGICNGRSVMVPGLQRLVQAPIYMAEAAWRV